MPVASVLPPCQAATQRPLDHPGSSSQLLSNLQKQLETIQAQAVAVQRGQRPLPRQVDPALATPSVSSETLRLPQPSTNDVGASCAGVAPLLSSHPTSVPLSLASGDRAGSGVGGTFYEWMLGMLPQPVYVRAVDGSLLYANKAGAEAASVPAGGVIEPWQVTPAAVLSVNDLPSLGVLESVSGSPNEFEGELDLPRTSMPAGIPLPPLPPPCAAYRVLVLDQVGVQRCLLSMHRIPFWLNEPNGCHHAVVLYVGG